MLVAELERRKIALAAHPRDLTGAASRSRHVPAAVKREVWQRDNGQCAFVGTEGRCRERGFLEYHHVVPYADGGTTTTENFELRCRAHNAHEMEIHFGPLFVRERSDLELGPDLAARGESPSSRADLRERITRDGETFES